jgi:salicylate hydroxylase
MRLEGLRIAVVGAGIGGLAAAAALAQRRARVRVFEQAPALGEVGAGLQIAPNGVAVLEALGMRDAAELRASLPEAVELVDFRGGRPVARVPLGQAIVARHGRPYWHLHRADLLAVLAAGCDEAAVELSLGATVEAVAAEGAGLRVRTAGGGGGRFDLVVAADGVRSGLRTAHLDPGSPRFTGHVAWRALVPASRAPAELLSPAARVTMGPGRHLVSYPLRGASLVNLVAVEAREAWAEEGWSLPDDPAKLRRAFAGWGGAAGALIEAVDACWLWGLFDHAPLAGWLDGRLALLGDACHPMLPFLAQGATMALEDAWVLADCLDLAEDPATGLRAYEAARLARTARVQRAAARAGRLYHLRPGVRAPVHAALAAVSAVAPSLLARRFDWLFGHDVTATG